MNAIQKVAFAASALAITLVGAALVTAPMAFAHPMQVVAQGGCSTPAAQVTPLRLPACQNVSRDLELVALNRR